MNGLMPEAGTSEVLNEQREQKIKALNNQGIHRHWYTSCRGFLSPFENLRNQGTPLGHKQGLPTKKFPPVSSFIF